MSTLTHRETRPLADLVDWLEAPLVAFRPLAGQAIRIEELISDGHFVVRAELPGLDPEKDVQVTVSDGILTLRGERHETKEAKDHSEFRYGSFSRRVALPAGADEDRVQASYDRGILEVVVGLRKLPEQRTRRIPVRLLQHIKPT
jgi:HSP20 family molecular chaperone IbpA